MTAQNAALELAKELGLPVFPCQPADKRPYTDNGFRDATTDPEVVKHWWKRWPKALVGVPTDRISRLVVVDIDPDGADWYREHMLELRCRRVHRTRRGHHLLYRMPEVEIRNSAGRIAGSTCAAKATMAFLDFVEDLEKIEELKLDTLYWARTSSR